MLSRPTLHRFACSVLAVAWLGGAARAQPPRPTPPSVDAVGVRLAFVVSRNGSEGIYVVNGDGSGQVRLTDSSYDTMPQWTPDGSRIAFASIRGRDGFGELAREGGLYTQRHYHVMNADGTDIHRLAPMGMLGLKWSPDAQRIAFWSGFEDKGNWGAEIGTHSSAIYTMAEGNDEPQRLTEVAGHDGPFSWSKDSKRILYAANPTSGRDHKGNWDVWVMNADGSAKTNLSDHPAADTDPIWSADGTRVVYRSDRDGEAKLRVLTLDTGELQSLPPISPFDTPLYCTPDGRIIFSANTRVWAMDFDGGNPAQIARVNTGFAFLRAGDVALSTDGRTLAYVSRRGIFITSIADGSHVQITNGGGHRQLSFAPR